MAFYKKQADKKSGDGLALTEWNDLHNAVAGNAGLTLALHPDDKIGIGTETPEEAMEIKKTSPVLSIHNPNVSTFKIGSDANGFKIAAMDNGFGGHRGNFPNNNSQVFFMSKTGNVGIGITKLNERLEVNGNVKAAKFIGDGSQLTNLSVGATGLNLATTANSRVGIGISPPAAKLHVINAETNANGNTLILGPVTGSNLRLGYHKDYSWIQSHGSKPLKINPVGNYVIIGGGDTSTPTEMLQVEGNIKANRFIGIRMQWGQVLTTDWINNWDAVMNYTVPDDHVMVGLYSEHNNSREDRRFKVKYRKLTLIGG